MAEELVSGILDALKQAHARRRERADQEFRQNQANNENMYRQQQVDLEHQRLDQQSKQFDITSKAAKALHDVQIAKAKLDVEAATPGSETQQKQLEADVQRSSALQGPNSPVVQGKMAETEASKKADLERFQMQKDEDYRRQLDMKTADDHRAELDRVSREHIAQTQAGARITAANIGASSRLKAAEAKAIPPVDPKPYLEGLSNGDYTRDDILKVVPDKKQAMMILNDFSSKIGGVPLQDKQKAALTNFGDILPVIPKMEEFNKILMEHEALARLPGTAEYKRLNELGAEIEQLQPKYARIVEGLSGRISNQQIEFAKKAFNPSVGLLKGSTVENENKRKALIQTLNAAIDNVLSSQSPGQRAVIKQNLGLLPKAQSAVPQQGQPAAPASQTQQAPGNGEVHWERDPKTGKLKQVTGPGGQ